MLESGDPCQIATCLRQAYTDLVGGRAEVLIRFGEEEVRYGKADFSRLERMIRDYEAQCAASKGLTITRTRFARRSGFRPY